MPLAAGQMFSVRIYHVMSTWQWIFCFVEFC